MPGSKRRILIYTSSVLLVLVVGVLLLLVLSNRPAGNNADNLPPLSVTLTPEKARLVSVVPYVQVHPMPGAQLTLEEYRRGMQRPGYASDPRDIYNICIISDVRFGRTGVCLESLSTTPPSTIVTPCRTNPYPELDDAYFWRNLEITLDGKPINGGRMGNENTYEEPDRYSRNTYLLCYRVPLDIGTHKMTYTFTWSAANIVDKAQWEFTLRP